MTIQINIDGWPYQILFSGTIDIERMYDGETVAIRSNRKTVQWFAPRVDLSKVCT